MKKTEELKIQNTLCKNLKFLREFCELTQQQIAYDLHIDRSTYTYWECGKTMPPIFKLKALIEFYRKKGMKLDYNLLLEGLITLPVIQGISE